MIWIVCFSLVSFHHQIKCIGRVYNLYNEYSERVIDEDRPTVFSASASQSFIDMPSSHYSSYHDSHDAVNNHNDAQIQGKCRIPLKWCFHTLDNEVVDVVPRGFVWEKSHCSEWNRRKHSNWSRTEINVLVLGVYLMNNWSLQRCGKLISCQQSGFHGFANATMRQMNECKHSFRRSISSRRRNSMRWKILLTFPASCRCGGDLWLCLSFMDDFLLCSHMNPTTRRFVPSTTFSIQFPISQIEIFNFS